MDNHTALNPQHSVVVEACAGSGKTWLLVSRIVRLLLAGVLPGEILAITFTRKAAQEMQARLHEWLRLLATQDDAAVRHFLKERELHEVDDALLAKARGLYRDFLLAQPSISISTFHGWFMQIIQRAPLNAGVPVGMQLLERTAALHEEAWQAYTDSLRDDPESETSQSMQWLFEKYGLHSTRSLLGNFVAKRAEWWAYTSGQEDAVGYALEQLRSELDVDLDADPIADACSFQLHFEGETRRRRASDEDSAFGTARSERGSQRSVTDEMELESDASLHAAVQAFGLALATMGTETQGNHANKLQITWEIADVHQRFAALSLALYTQADEPRSFKPTKKQDVSAFLLARDVLFGKLQAVRDALVEQESLRMNQAALRCGAALLRHYQELKLRSQQMDFTDLEWQVCYLLNQSDCAEYMQYKLDSRYKHVLLDEFQDTNPLQWQTLQSWFAAAAAVDSRPTVFVVGDPKQSIYRFRRADARLFGEVRGFLQQEFAAHYLTQNETRRNAPAVLQAVNGVFASLPDGFVDFEEHIAHHKDLPGYVEILPLLHLPLAGDGWGAGMPLRNPLTTPHAEESSGARELEAEQFAAHIANIVTNWSVQEENGTLRRAEYRDIMVLVRKRIHLRVYEHALRARHIPFLTSRRGGLLDTLEAEDIQALLTFLITPFADLELAQALRSPIFSCSDDDLMLLAQHSAPSPSPPTPIPQGERGGWWARLTHVVGNGAASPQLQRAHHLLQSWLSLADKLPVHDLLDRIYFEGDLVHRYAAALPAELRETVRANLQAFMEIALNVDAGRYPSLPRFLAELRELRAAENESPDEGRVGEVGNALRIYTVHEAKGLEAPIVWLLDANDTQRKTDSYNVLLDWPPNAPRPAHFSLFSDKRGRGARRAHYFEADEEYARREEMNLLYVAMTRAKQALLVSGNGEAVATSWYGRIAAAVSEQPNSLSNGQPVGAALAANSNRQLADSYDAALLRPLPTGQRAARNTAQQQRGIWLHALLQHLTPPSPLTPLPLAGEGSALAREREALRQLCGIPAEEMDALYQQAQALLAQAPLQRFFDPQHYLSANNEMPYVNAAGELKRIDRLVEFDNEVWVLDYKLGDSEDVARYRAQMQEYRAAMQSVYAGKTVRCALLLADGTLSEVG